MTDVAFHFNLPDKLGYACRLLRKAVGAGSQVIVTGEPHVLQQLDQLLWTFAPLEFIPHCWADASEAMLSRTPVVLQADLQVSVHQDVLVSLHPDVVPGFERFARLIELVGPDDADRQMARLRWKRYQEQGYTITRHDVAAKSAAAQ